MAFIPTLDSSRKLRKKFLSEQSLAELAVEANVWRTAQDNRYVTRAEYVAGGSGIAPTIFDAKGDLIVASANDTPLRLAAGGNGRTLVADSNDIAGLRWAERPALYTNLLRNPSVETNTTNVAAIGSGVTVTRVTTEQYVGTASARAVCDGTVANQGLYFETANGLPIGVYAAAAWVKAPAGTAMRVFLFGNGSESGNAPRTFTATGSWQRVQAPAGATSSTTNSIGIFVDTATPQAVTFYVDAATLVAGTEVPDYFDGDTAGCYWTGTAHASTSVRAALSVTDGVGRQSLPTLTRNLVTNPSFELGTAGWTLGSGATIARNTSNKYVGTASLAVTTAASTAGSGALIVSTARPRVTPGQTYTASFYALSAAGNTFLAVVAFYNEAGAFVSSGSLPTPTATGAWQRVSGSVVAPAGVATAAIFVYRDTGASVVIYLDAVQFEEGARATAYTDGDQKGCYWTGTPHASESVRMVRGDDGISELDLPELATNLIVNPGPRPNSTTGYVPASNSGQAAELQNQSPSGWALAHTVGVNGPSWLAADNVPAQAGTFTMRGRVACVSGTSSPVFLNAAAFNSSGAFLGDIATPSATPTGTASTLYGTVTLPSGTAYVSVQLRTNAGIGGAKYHWWSLQATQGSSLPAYFDGDSVGASWLSTPGRSASVLRVPSAADYAMLTWLDAGRAQGVGSPEGAVTAPVGTRYVDTAGTAGAVEWQKWTGTGATGWVATGSDTGDRLIASLITNLGDATLVARRVGSQVTVTLIQPTAGTATGAVSLTTLPVGFRPTRTGSIVAAPVTNEVGGAVTGALLAVGADGAVVLTGATNATRHYAQVTYTTANAYPTTLPGTAA